MRAVLIVGLALVASAFADVTIPKSYHDEVGIPEAEKIKSYEDTILANTQVGLATDEVRIVGGVAAPVNAHPYLLADKLPAQLAELGLRPRSMTPATYTIRRITPNDRDLTLKFLRKFFFRDEPMNLAVNLLETAESRCTELEDYAAGTLEEGVSVAAVDENGDFVGVIINGIARRDEVDYTDKSNECDNPKFRRILRVLGHLDSEAKIWEKLPKCCDSVLEVRIASTHSAWRGRGLMRVLCEESERIAKVIGAGAMRMDTTSAFSAAAAERLGYKMIYRTQYADLPFAPQPEPPHLDARVYIKEL